MKKHVVWMMISVFLVSGTLPLIGCKEEAPAIPTAEPASPAPAQESPPPVNVPDNPHPAVEPKEDNPAPQSAHAGVHWFTNYDEARGKAQKENKDLVINFSGSDWCGFCIRLEKDVFSQEAFAKEAEKYFVFMLVDFPSDPSGQSAQVRRQNEQLARLYRFRGYFPTIFLAGPDGRPYAEAEYKEGGPKVYLDYLLRIRQYKNR